MYWDIIIIILNVFLGALFAYRAWRLYNSNRLPNFLVTLYLSLSILAVILMIMATIDAWSGSLSHIILPH